MKYHIKATIELFNKRPIFSGLRSQFYYMGRDWDCVISFEDEKLFSKELNDVYLTLLSPDLQKDNIKVGMPFLLREGARVIAFGSVLEINEETFSEGMNIKIVNKERMI